jgi:hypothetical protein
LSAEDITASTADIDLDEDLFDFPQVMLEPAVEEDEADLDEVFATIEEDNDDLDFEPPTSSPAAEPTIAETVIPLDSADPGTPAATAEPVAAASVSAAPTTAPGGIAAAPAPGSNAPMMVMQGGGVSKSILWIFLAITSVNLLLAIIFFSSTSGMRDDVREMSDKIGAAANTLAEGTYEARTENLQLTTPIVSPSPENHPAFSTALEEIGRGEFTSARRRLYALLSVVDRIDPADRAKVESRANYLIAHAWQLEVVTRTEEER